MNEIRRVQEEVAPWSEHNFGDVEECPPIIAVVGLGEEAGEVLRALLKQHQQIRGTWQEWQDELAKELGDVFIKLCDVAQRANLDLADCIFSRWEDVRTRDFKANAKGHGMPSE